LRRKPSLSGSSRGFSIGLIGTDKSAPFQNSVAFEFCGTDESAPFQNSVAFEFAARINPRPFKTALHLSFAARINLRPFKTAEFSALWKSCLRQGTQRMDLSCTA
jgi:hypothetical protein